MLTTVAQAALPEHLRTREKNNQQPWCSSNFDWSKDANSSVLSVLSRELSGNVNELNCTTFVKHAISNSKTLPLPKWDIGRFLCSCGLSSVTLWGQQYKYLSRGQQSRATATLVLIKFARAYYTDHGQTILLDKFDTLLDDATALSLSISFGKAIKRIISQHSSTSLSSSSSSSSSSTSSTASKTSTTPHIFMGLNRAYLPQALQPYEHFNSSNISSSIPSPPTSYFNISWMINLNLNSGYKHDNIMEQYGNKPKPPTHVSSKEVSQLTLTSTVRVDPTTKNILSNFGMDWNGANATDILYPNSNPSGQVTVLYGPSGCGKTTILAETCEVIICEEGDSDSDDDSDKDQEEEEDDDEEKEEEEEEENEENDAEEEEEDYETHLALNDETPQQIATQHGISIDQLLNANNHLNGLKRNSKLYLGTEIYIPNQTNVNNGAAAAAETAADVAETANPPGNDKDEHDYECNACDEGGDLMCCNFCTLTYHATCLPSSKGNELPEVFACPVCISEGKKSIFKDCVYEPDTLDAIKEQERVEDWLHSFQILQDAIGFDEFGSFQSPENKIKLAARLITLVNADQIKNVSCTTLDLDVAKKLYEGGARVWDVANSRWRTFSSSSSSSSSSSLTSSLVSSAGLINTMDLQIIEVDGQVWWPHFSRYHYMSHVENSTGGLNKAARTYLLIHNNQAIGMSSFMSAMGGFQIKNVVREHRTVISPEWQGMGIGVKFVREIARTLMKQGIAFYSRTKHPALIAVRERSAEWAAVRSTSGKRDGGYSHFFVGDPRTRLKELQNIRTSKVENKEMALRHLRTIVNGFDDKNKSRALDFGFFCLDDATSIGGKCVICDKGKPVKQICSACSTVMVNISSVNTSVYDPPPRKRKSPESKGVKQTDPKKQKTDSKKKKKTSKGKNGNGKSSSILSHFQKTKTKASI